MQEFVMIQAALAHLGMAMRFLDELDADVSAAYVEAALQAMKEEPSVRRTFAELQAKNARQYAEIDQLIEEMFESGNGLVPTSIAER